MITHPARNPDLQLSPGTLVSSHVNGRRFRVKKFLGVGGFGATYRVSEVAGTANSQNPEYCLKITGEPTGWYREAYFGDMLNGISRVIQVYEAFAWVPNGRDRKPLYCLITELAHGGDLASWLERNRQPWKESEARREMIGLLRVVARLHEHAVHRDITPRNIFVMSDHTLKLADFGIAAHSFGKRPVRADAFAPWLAPPAIVDGEILMWKQADDVYQLGQLFAMLLTGSAERRFTTRDVKKLTCSPEAKSVVQRCIGLREKRFPEARTMLAALERQQPPPRKIGIRSFKGKRVVFTGRLSITRARAQRMVKRVGGLVERHVSHITDVLVVGTDSPFWKADRKGQKLLDIDRERERGHYIVIMNERRFKDLAGWP